MKQKHTHRQREQTCGCQWGVGREGLGISRCKLFYIGWINNKVLLYSTGNYIQYPVINHNGKEYLKKECQKINKKTKRESRKKKKRIGISFYKMIVSEEDGLLISFLF